MSDEPSLAPLIFGPTVNEDVNTDVVFERLFEDPIRLHRNPIQREVFERLDEHSSGRSRGEIQQRLDRLMCTMDTREEAIAFDVLRWVIDEDIDWVVDEYIEDRSQPEEIHND